MAAKTAVDNRPPFVTVFRTPDSSRRIPQPKRKIPKPRIRLYTGRKPKQPQSLPSLGKTPPKPILSPRREKKPKKEINFKLPEISSNPNRSLTRRPSYEDPLPIGKVSGQMLEVISRETSMSDSTSLVSIPENPATLGIGATMWLHKFVYNTKKKSVTEEEVVSDLKGGRKKVLKRQETKMTLEVEAKKDGKRFLLERRASWTALRTQLVNAKVTDAFTNKKFRINNKVYTVLNIIGSGGYSTVYDVFDEDKEIAALKVVDLTEKDDDVKQSLMREVEFLELFEGSEHVIQLLGMEHQYLEDGTEKLYILMERGECDLGTILSSLRKNEKMTPSKLRYYWEQMLEAVEVIHKHGVIHGDLKPANFLLVRGQLKLIDFGLAGFCDPGTDTIQRDCVMGTRDYISPESFAYIIIDKERYFDFEAMKERKNFKIILGFKSDVWSLGVILFQLVYNGAAPFSGVPGGKEAKLKALIAKDYPVEFEPVDDQDLLNTMKLCLQKDVDHRADLQTLLNHPFLRPEKVIKKEKKPVKKDKKIVTRGDSEETAYPESSASFRLRRFGDDLSTSSFFSVSPSESVSLVMPNP